MSDRTPEEWLAMFEEELGRLEAQIEALPPGKEAEKLKRRCSHARLRINIVERVERCRQRRTFLHLCKEHYGRVFYIYEGAVESQSLHDGGITCAYCDEKLATGAKAWSIHGRIEDPEMTG